MSTENFEFGELVEDKTTGFMGTIVGKLQYQHGPVQWLVRARNLTKDGSVIKPEWFDESELKRVNEKRS